MKIAFLMGQFPTLSETFILNQITGLLELGHTLTIFSMSEPASDKVHSDVEKFHLRDYIQYPPKPPQSKLKSRLLALQLLVGHFLRSPGKVWSVLRIICKNRKKYSLTWLKFVLEFPRDEFDVLHCHFGPYGNLGVDLKRTGLRAKLVTAFHGYDANTYLHAGKMDFYMELFRWGALFTANTTFTKQQMMKLGCDETKIRILPEGLRMECFTYHPRDRFSEESIRFLTVARLTEKKGLEFSIRAVAKVIQTFPQIIYTIVGDGPLKKNLTELVTELGLEQHVEFRGALANKEVMDLYAQSQAFILSSVTASDGDREGQGLVLQEAQACGLPVLSTYHNGIPDGVLEGRSGFLVEEKDVDALAERMSYLLEHTEVWPEMGRCGREFVEKNYDIGLLNRRLLTMYEDLL